MSDNTKKCPFCGEEILAVAKKCKHCGEWLEKEKQEEKKVKKDYSRNVDIYTWVITIGIVLLIPMPIWVACLIGAIAGVANTIIKTILKDKTRL